MRFSEFGRPSYKTTVEIDDEVFVGVNYILDGVMPGSSMSNKNNYLLDDPTIRNIQVFDLDTNAEITSTMTPHDIESIKDSIMCDISKDTRGY